MTGECTTISVETRPAEARTPGQRRRLGRWGLITGASILVIAGIVLIVLALNWPFTQQAVTTALEHRFARTVQIQSFRKTYFPPGCVAEGVSFLHREGEDLPPLISVQALIIRGSYYGLLRIHKRVDDVQVKGLHVLIAPPAKSGRPPNVIPLTTSTSGNSVTIGAITADDALLEFMPRQPGHEPFKLRVHRLTFDQVSEGRSIPYHVTLLNPEPPGEIRSDGKIGPWDEDDPGSTPVTGSYTYEHANLAVFEGIAGSLTSRGKFSGTIGHMDTNGETDVPDFRVSGSSHTVHLTSKFQAVVDGTNGDTYLQNVEAHFQGTTVTSSGSVAGHPGQHGKSARLEMAVNGGRIEDLLYLFTEEKHSSMTGSINLRAKVEVPPGPPGFLRKLDLAVGFGIGSGRFTDTDLQQSVNTLTQSARGENKKQQAENPETVLSNLKGRISVNNGVATLSNISFSAPGTLAELHGTYNLLDRKVDLHGILHTNGKLSDTTSGFKALVLKAVGPFLKKKSVTVVPFTITGTSSNPSFALDFAGKSRESSLPPAGEPRQF
ncbi:MAG: AsmA-like C-terminal region-containing protein [Acidobacteriia bacterium]|nr:AsmA-like C-terminal region-containing protein [Terriglobia bacterium]